MTRKLLLCVVLFGSTACNAGVINFGNIVFIGDSITEGANYRPDGNGNYSWRYSFWKDMIDHGDSFAFVGSRTSNYSGTVNYPVYQGFNFENRHEAVWGTTSFERATTLAGGYGDLNGDGSNLAADTAFVLLGSNDASNPSNTLTSIRDQFQTIVNGLQNANPNVNINLISVLPRFINDTNGDGFADSPYSRNSEYAALNVLLADLAVSQTNATSNVNFVDVASQMTPQLYYDGLHPNGAGEILVGDFVYNNAINSMAAVPEPSSVFLLLGVSIGFGFVHRKTTRKVVTKVDR